MAFYLSVTFQVFNIYCVNEEFKAFKCKLNTNELSSENLKSKGIFFHFNQGLKNTLTTTKFQRRKGIE